MVDQLRDLSDARLVDGCVYCGGRDETRDHVPSRIFLDLPFPENLPVVPACGECNRGFSSDEEYLACLIEAAVQGTTDPEGMRRERIAKTLRRQHLLRARIDASREVQEGRTSFIPEKDRVRNVVLKLARGHAAFELSAVRRDEPNFWGCWPLEVMNAQARNDFEAPHFPELFGEIGSRGLQRTMVVTAELVSPEGDHVSVPFVMNDWIDVQEGRYRYLAYEAGTEIVVKMVIGEYLACLVSWEQ